MNEPLFIWDFVADTILGQIVDWIYGQVMGFLGNFFAEMGNMGVELFELSWVQSIVLFFSYLAWALYVTGLVVACFECGIEYSSGRGNLKETALCAIKGFMAVSLFTVVPIRLYELSVTLQASLTAGITGYGTSIGEAATEIVDSLSGIDSLTGMTTGSYFGFASITSPIMLLFCIILMAYAVIKGLLRKPKARRHSAHSNCSGQSLYVQRPTGLSGRLYGLGAAGHRFVPDRLPPVHHPHCGTHGVQGPRADGRGAHALRWRSAAHRRQLRLGHHNKGQYYERRLYGAGCRQHHPNHRRGDQMKG